MLLDMIRLISFLILVATIALGIYFWTNRVSTLESFLSKRLNSKVSLDEVRLGWGRLTLRGLQIETPSSKAFRSDEIVLEMSPFAFFKKTVYVEKIKIQNPTLSLELYNSSGSENNWVRLLNGFPSGSGKKFIIRKLVIINLRFDVTRSNGKPVSIPPLPYLELQGLGEKGALTVSQLGQVIFQALLQTVVSQGHLGALLDNVRQLPQDVLEHVRSTLPIEEGRGVMQEGLETLRRKSHEASEFLQDLFSGK